MIAPDGAGQGAGVLVLDHSPELVIPQQQHQPGPAHAADGRSRLFTDPCARRLQVGEKVGAEPHQATGQACADPALMG